MPFDQTKQNNDPLLMRFLADALRGRSGLMSRDGGNPSWDSMGRPMEQQNAPVMPFLQDETAQPVEDAISKMRREQEEALRGAGGY